MNKKNSMKKIILGIILILAIIIAIYLLIFNKDTLNQNNYRIETDMKWITMLNDGGSHTNVYYDVDFDNNVITKINHKYTANLGGTPKNETKEIYKKELKFKTKKDLTRILKETLTKEDVNETNNYNCFTIYDSEKENRICNEKTIKKLKDILNTIDNS